MSQLPTRGRGSRPSRAPAKPAPEAHPVSLAFAALFDRLAGLPADLLTDPVSPPGDAPAELLQPFGVSGWDKLPRRVRSDPRLKPLDKLVYLCLASTCWGECRETVATNAKIRARLGGKTRLETYGPKGGARQIVESGPCDKTLQRCFRRLIDCRYIERLADPCTHSRRRFVLLEWGDEQSGTGI